MTLQSSRRDFMKVAGLTAGIAVAPTALLAGAVRAEPPTSVPTGAGMGAGAGALASGAVPFRVGQWLPSDQAVLDRWLNMHIAAVAANPKPLLPVVQEFKDLIENNPTIYMYFRQMFSELPKTKKFDKTSMGTPQVKSYQHMLELINDILTTAPEFNKTGMVGFPINAILDWPMATDGGFGAFLNVEVNAALKKILDHWGQFLTSSDSRYVLGTDRKTGWFGRDAMAAMPDFDTHFQCDHTQPYHGFTSWDDFFTRQFRSGQRPIASPGDDSVIVSACESAPYKIERNVKTAAKFWIKAQPYSLRHMMADDPLTSLFVGGTIYQAFLSALSYHRWHAPVSGTILKTYVVPGTYYSEAQAEGFDPVGPNESQGYITEVATRALIYIQADNPAIGLMCFMAVGMAEVSTCDVTVKVGQHVNKGDQTGMFHFGGSTHCLFFRPGVDVDFDLHGQKPGLNSHNIEVNSKLGVVRS